MKWYKDISKIIKNEPEEWLEYLYGQQINNIPHLMAERTRYKGWPVQILKYFIKLILNIDFRGQKLNPSKDTIMFFAGTDNQLSALNTTVQSLVEQGAEVKVFVDKKLSVPLFLKKNSVQCKTTLMDACKASILFIIYGRKLYKRLKNIHPHLSLHHFSKFCEVYSELVTFHRVLSELDPMCVVVANDHNSPNRCLLAISHYFSIETAYMQHASVSDLFPALRVNYAFLDGKVALETYRKCVKNRPGDTWVAPQPLVVLSGQKKEMWRTTASGSRKVGLAINSLDKVDDVIKLVKELAHHHIGVTVRWHPRQALSDIKKFKNELKSMTCISISNPASQSTSRYLSTLDYLIAGNSSIHLEAALAGVIPVYYEIAPQDISDYYGYVENGISIVADTVNDIARIVVGNEESTELSIDAIRNYSSSYRTEWENKEGELVAKCLLNFLHKIPNLPLDTHFIR